MIAVPVPDTPARENTVERTRTARRRRRGLTIGGLAVVIAAAVLATTLLLGRGPSQTPPPSEPPSDPAPAPEAGSWDMAAQTALATRPMLALPEPAALPHTLSPDTAGPPITLPAPTQRAGRWVPGGFPNTREGALAQLAALTTAGFAGADPQTYAAAYESVALPGAPDPQQARLTTDLRRFRARAGLPATGTVPDLTVTYQPTHGLIKGTTDGGRYAVVCVLGELTVSRQGRSVSGGAGDCQALRYVDGDWRISPGAAAAPAPLAWPGSAESVAAGYREVQGNA